MRVSTQPSLGFELYEYDPECATSTEVHLDQHEFVVWYRNLGCPPSEVTRIEGFLSPDELDRAARFRFDSDRNDYIVSRGTLRSLLGVTLGIPPHEVRFTYSRYGKPSLGHGALANGLDFNISHSSGVVLLAFALGRRIGIDIEAVRRDFSTTEIAERFFSMAERTALRQLPYEQRHEAFFRCWTRKEAFIKALGEGLSHPLDQFDVNLAPEEPASLLATRPDPTEVERWTLWNVPIPGDFAAAIVVERYQTGTTELPNL